MIFSFCVRLFCGTIEFVMILALGLSLLDRWKCFGPQFDISVFEKVHLSKVLRTILRTCCISSGFDIELRLCEGCVKGLELVF